MLHSRVGAQAILTVLAGFPRGAELVMADAIDRLTTALRTATLSGAFEGGLIRTLRVLLQAT